MNVISYRKLRKYLKFLSLSPNGLFNRQQQEPEVEILSAP